MDQYPTPQSAPQPQGNPYDFILNPQKPKKTFIGLKGFGRTIALIIGGTILVMIIAVLAINAFAPKKISKGDMLSLAQSQTELLRLTEQGKSGATQQITRNFSTTINTTLLTQQQQTIGLLSKNGAKVNPKELALKQNATSDQKLASAKATSTYDKAFTGIVQNELQSYSNLLKQLASKASTQEESNRLGDYYQQSQMLLSQIPYTNQGIDAAGQ